MAELRFTILGCGSSGGVPRVGGIWGACDPSNPNAIPSNVLPYLKLPPSTRSVSVELTYADGTVSETKTFRR